MMQAVNNQLQQLLISTTGWSIPSFNEGHILREWGVTLTVCQYRFQLFIELTNFFYFQFWLHFVKLKKGERLDSFDVSFADFNCFYLSK